MEEQHLLKHWLRQGTGRKNWGWQVIIDALAIGESLPLRMVCYSCLQNLYDNIAKLLTKEQHKEKLDAFKCAYPNKAAWDIYVKELMVWAADPIVVVESESFNLKDLTSLLSEIYPSLASKIFPALPANPFPMEMLSRMSFPEYRVFCLLWFYNWMIIKNQVPQETNQSVRCDGKALAFLTMNMSSKWVASDIPECEYDHETHKNWLMVIGPCFGGTVSILSEAEYDDKTIAPVVEFIKHFSHATASDGLFHFHRFTRAAREATPLPWAELELRQKEVHDAIALLLECNITALNGIVKRHDLYHSALWALFNAQHKTKIKELLVWQDCTLFFHYDQDYSPENVQSTLDHKPTCLVVNCDGNNSLQLVVCDESNTPQLKLKQVDTQISEYGFVLHCDNASEVDSESLEALRILLSHLHIRAYEKSRLLDSKRLLIVSDRLHRELGRVGTSGENYPSLGICEWIAGLLRSESAILYRYDTHVGEYSRLKGIDGFFLMPSNAQYQDAIFKDMENIANRKEDRARSVSYRAVDKNSAQVCLAYDPETQQAIPKNSSLYRSDELKHLSLRSAIVVPVRFNGRRQGAIEVGASHPWQFSWGQQVVLEQAAAIIAPYFYQQRFLRALNRINQKVSTFHRGRITELDLYEQICSALASLFLCDGASLWVRKKNERHLLERKGSHNIKRSLEIIDLSKSELASQIVQNAEQQNSSQLFHIIEPRNVAEPNILMIDELHSQGVQHVALLPLVEKTTSNNQQKRMIAVISLYTRDDIGFGASWNGIMSYMGGFLRFVVEAVNAFVHERKLTNAVVQHEIWHDAAYLAHKAAHMARKREPLKDRLTHLTRMIQTDWFKEKLNEAPIISEQWSRKDANDVGKLAYDIDMAWFLPQKDMQYFAKTLKTRIEALFSEDSLDSKSKNLILATGDDEIIEDIRGLVNINEDEEFVDLKKIINLLKEKHPEVTHKGLYISVDIERSILVQPTVITTVLRNLLDNAFKYSFKNTSINFKIEPKTSGGVLLIIENEGGAMEDMCECSNMLEKEERGSNAAGIQGHGLGLYLVKSLCQYVLRFDFNFQGEPLKQRPGALYTATLDIPANRVRRNN